MVMLQASLNGFIQKEKSSQLPQKKVRYQLVVS
jgi:hypothetical protein